MHTTGLDQHHIKTARRQRATAQQVVARGKDDALAFDRTDAGTGTAKVSPGAAAHLDEDQRAVSLAHDQVDLAATTPRRSIIALHQHQARSLQMRQRRIFGLLASNARGDLPIPRFCTAKDSH